jgi:hypothetical protein
MGSTSKHLRDIAGILKLRGDSIDREYLSNAADQLGLASVWQSISVGEKPN